MIKKNSPLLAPEKIATMTNSDWKEKLSTDAYYVLREKGTERPFSGRFTNFKEKGVFTCAGCGLALFASEAKFDSGCGWPSFDKTINQEVVIEHSDFSHGMRRMEVTCGNCSGHLGHVFDDGPQQTTGLRYCINSVSLNFDSLALNNKDL